jgi:hypothetical protein
MIQSPVSGPEAAPVRTREEIAHDPQIGDAVQHTLRDGSHDTCVNVVAGFIGSDLVLYVSGGVVRFRPYGPTCPFVSHRDEWSRSVLRSYEATIPTPPWFEADAITWRPDALLATTSPGRTQDALMAAIAASTEARKDPA